MFNPLSLIKRLAFPAVATSSAPTQRPPAGPVERVSTTPKTAGYVSIAAQYQLRPRDLPPLGFDQIRSMLLDPAVRLGLQMRIAPICGVEIAYNAGNGPDGKPKWVPGVLAKRPEVGEFVRRQLARIWTHGLEEILSAQVWGWSAGEVMLRATSRGTVEIDYLLGRHAIDTRALIRRGSLVGTRVMRVQNGHSNSNVDLEFPKSWFHSYRPEAGAFYGQSILLGAYSPWADKAFQGGATDVRRLFMHADAYGGKDMTYPDGVTIVNGQEVSNRDLALQIIEQLQAGGVTARPAVFDGNGNELWKLTRATVASNPAHILQFPKDLDTEIYHGLEIPDDVIESETGAWAGKRIPMAAFYNSLDLWVMAIIGTLTEQLLEPLVMLNFGRAEEFSVTHKPLGQQAMEQQGDAGQGQGSQQPGQSNPQQPSAGNPQQQYQAGPQQPGMPPQQRMGLDPVEAVGHGVLNAAELVQAAREVIDSRGVARMASMGQPHSFSSTQFDLPGEICAKIQSMQSRINPSDLAPDGLELQPHITVKYGLHTDDPEEVRSAAMLHDPVAVTFGKCTIFPGEEHDVVKVDVESNGLRDLNQRLSDTLPHTDTHPGYKPHATIAYVRSGLGERIASTLNDLEGAVAVFDRVTFSDKLRNHHSIPLIGRSKRFSADPAGAKWVTIGGRRDGNDKHAGGFPVQLDENGIVLKGGPKGLRGKHVSKIVSHFKRMRNTPAAKAKRAESMVKKQAKSWDMSPDQYRQFVDQIWKDKADEHKTRESAKADARKSLGVTAGDVRRLEEQGFDYGSGKIKGLDTVGRELATQYPELNWGGGYGDDAGKDVDDTDYDAKVWELLKEGKVALPAKDSPEFHQEVDEYLNYLADQTGGGSSDDSDEQDDDSPIPFGLQRSLDFDEDEHPRGDDGKFARGGGKATTKAASKSTSKPKHAPTDIHQAVQKIIDGDRKSSLGQGHTTLVSMEDLRRHLPQYSKEELDAEIRKLRESGEYTMETGHGRTTPEMRDAGIKEGPDNLIWISRR